MVCNKKEKSVFPNIKISLAVAFLFFSLFSFSLTTPNARWVSGYEIVGNDTLLVDSVRGRGNPNWKVTYCADQLDNINNGYISAKSRCLLNGQPIITLFPNANYADTTFFLMESHDTNKKGVEILPYRLTRIEYYESGLTGQDSVDVNEAFGTPFPLTTTMITCGDGGYWATLTQAKNNSNSYDTIIMFDGYYSSRSTLNLSKRWVYGVGNVKYEHSATNYAFYYGSGSIAKLSGMYIRSADANTFPIFNLGIKYEMEKIYADSISQLVRMALTTSEYLSVNKCYCNVYVGSNPMMTNTADTIYIADCLFDNFNGTRYIDNDKADALVNINYSRFTNFNNIIYSENGISSFKAVGNRFDSIHFVLALSDGSNVHDYIFNSNIGIVQSVLSIAGNEIASSVQFNNNTIIHTGRGVLLNTRNYTIEADNNIILSNSNGYIFSFRTFIDRKIYLTNNLLYKTGLGGNTTIGDSASSSFFSSILVDGNIIAREVENNVHGVQVHNEANSIFTHNYVRNTSLVFKGNGENYSKAFMGYNLFRNGSGLLKGVDSAIVANNTFYSDTANKENFTIRTNRDYDNVEFSCQGNELYNNIFIQSGSTVSNYCLEVLFTEADSLSFITDHNIYYTDVDSIARVSNGNVADLYTFPMWQSIGYDKNGYFSDVNINSEGVPQSSSVAKGNGKNLGEPYNGGLSPLSVWPDSVLLRNQIDNAWSIGAFIVYDKFSLSVSASPTNGGEVIVNPSDTNFIEGESLSIVAVAADGYEFAKWNTGESKDTLNITMTADLNLIAYFKQEDSYNENDDDNIFILTVNASPEMGGEVIIGSSDTSFKENDSVKIIAVAADGYEFANWNTGETGDTLNITMTSDLDLIAYFEVKDSDSTNDINSITEKVIEPISFKVYPNPVTNVSNLKISTNRQTYASVSLINITGKREVLFNGQLKEGVALLPIDSDSFNKGVYVLQIITDYRTYSKNLIINN